MEWLNQDTLSIPDVRERLGNVRRTLRRARQEWENRPMKLRQGSDADMHHYLLRAPLDESAVASFEEKHNIQLPSDYRAFVRRLGDGGAGPHYGMLPLARWNWGSPPRKPRVPTPMRGYLSSLSPLDPEQPERKDWADRFQHVEWDALQGSIAIADRGEDRSTRLIVSGVAYGRVIEVDANDQPRFTDDVDFLAWYERWVDEQVPGTLTLN